MADYSLKPGVQGAVSNELNYALGFVKQFFDNVGKPFVITSLADSVHQVGSLHYQGQAVDIRTRDLSQSEKSQLASYLSSNLTSQGFDVILEQSHLHIEYDPKTGRSLNGYQGAAGSYASPASPKKSELPAPGYNFTYKLPMSIKRVIVLGIAIVLFLVAFSKLK